MAIDFSKIKIIIWDLDDTFWSGTLSEGEVSPIKDNISLVKALIDHGIINAVCSKNDSDRAEAKLSEMGVSNCFVFNSINWQPKGQRISRLLKDIGLRAENALFVDDNIVNLNEAKHYEPYLMISEPNILPDIIKYLSKIEPSDLKHKRLHNYQILEQKQESRTEFSDNLSFLFSTRTEVRIKHDCQNEIDRIYELVQRTNQLNFTKVRLTMQELVRLINDEKTQTGYVTVSDKFGDYGVVGFYALRDKELIHFLFSCRTIGQGVEQYVYSKLGCPELTIVGDVVNKVQNKPAPEWINQDIDTESTQDNKKLGVKVIVKGGCDLGAITRYLRSDLLINEMTYVGRSTHNHMEHQNHSINFLQFPFMSESERAELLDTCPFNDKDMFDTAIYDKDIDLIVLSTLIEPNLGVYKNKKTGYRIAWGEWCWPLTDESLWDRYIDGTIFNADNHFTKEGLKKFSENYEYEGRITIEEYIKNLSHLREKINAGAVLCLLLGSETAPSCENITKAYEGREIDNHNFNIAIRDFAKSHDKVEIIDFNEFIKTENDLTNNINHFQRRVYFQAAERVNEIINKYYDCDFSEKRYKKILDLISRGLHRVVPRDTMLFDQLKKLFQKYRYN